MKVSYTSYITAEISNQEANRIAYEVLRKAFNFDEDHYVAANGELCTLSDPHPHNGSQDVEVVRRATPQDKIVIEILEKLKQQSRI